MELLIFLGFGFMERKKRERKGKQEWKGNDLKYYLYNKLQNFCYFWFEKRRIFKDIE